MKIQVKGKAFLHQGLLIGNIYFTKKKVHVKRNIKSFGLDEDFSNNNVNINKRGSFVFVTYKLKNSYIQFLLTKNSVYNECPNDLKPLLEHGFKLMQTNTLKDVLGM